MSALSDPQSRAYARIAGIFYLTIAVAGGYAIAFVPSQLHVNGIPQATIANIIENRGFFLSGILGDVVMMVAEVVVTAMLFFMFRPVNATLSLAAALARFTMVTVMAAMLFFHAAVFGIAEGSIALPAFTEAQRLEVAYMFLRLHDAGVWIWQIFFTLHLLILGWLVVHSGLYPRLLGWGLMLGGMGYLLDSIRAFAFPEAGLLQIVSVALLVIVTLSEVGFALWLTFVGPRQKNPVRQDT